MRKFVEGNDYEQPEAGEFIYFIDAGVAITVSILIRGLIRLVRASPRCLIRTNQYLLLGTYCSLYVYV